MRKARNLETTRGVKTLRQIRYFSAGAAMA